MAYGIAAILFLGYLLYKTRNSVPEILGMALVTLLFLTNTGNIEQPNYFNKLSLGDADINIPKEDGEYYPI